MTELNRFATTHPYLLGAVALWICVPLAIVATIIVNRLPQPPAGFHRAFKRLAIVHGVLVGLTILRHAYYVAQGVVFPDWFWPWVYGGMVAPLLIMFCLLATDWKAFRDRRRGLNRGPGVETSRTNVRR